MAGHRGQDGEKRKREGTGRVTGALGEDPTLGGIMNIQDGVSSTSTGIGYTRPYAQ